MDYSAIPYRHPVPWDHAIEPRVLPDLLLDSAARDPKAPACDFMGRTTSYASDRRRSAPLRCRA